MTKTAILAALFFAVRVLYFSVGDVGASGYLRLIVPMGVGAEILGAVTRVAGVCRSIERLTVSGRRGVHSASATCRAMEFAPR